jgi:photosystem II stability/assembly factor-like uncharacterized protein
MGAAGDQWGATRGDESPGQRYALAEVTSSGRIMGLTWGGSLMYSDDGGQSWSFDRIEVDGIPVRGTFSDLYQVPGGPLIAVMRTLESSSEGFFSYAVKTWFLSSSNNGNTWTKAAFPRTYATLEGTTRRYYGVDITGLHMGPGGQLLAYGTTSGTNVPGFVLWSIGGAIFRQTGNDWVQAHFGYGPIGKLTDAGGRAVAVSHNAVLDSADGAGWNGYTMLNAQVTLNGTLMDTKTRSRLRLIDIEVLDGTYVAQGATFVPYGDSGLIDTNIFDQTFKVTSPTPFSPARNWTAYEEPYHGNFNKIGNRVVTSGNGPAFATSGGGPGFSLVQNEMNVRHRAIAVSSGGIAYGLESSDVVWKTTDGGSSWTKIRDVVAGPDLYVLGAVDGVIYATANRKLWRSLDLGETWQDIADDFRGFGTIVGDEGGRLFVPAGGRGLLMSEDNGFTWQTIGIADNGAASMLVESTSGRLVVPSEGKSISNEGVFYISNDNGATWSPTVAGLAWGENPKAIVQSASGRLIVASNSFASFDPKLYFSDDDGETWSSSKTLESLNGLDPISNEPWRRVIDIRKLLASPTGRLVMLGDDELLTSDDDGETWTVRVNMDTPQIGRNLFWEIRDVTRAGDRWIAVGNYRTPYPQSRYKNFLLISDDDGATWGQRPFGVKQTNTILLNAVTDPDSGRVVLTGTNGAVFVSDPDEIAPAPAAGDSAGSLTVREGTTTSVPVQRPDADGAVEAAYVLRGRSATPEVDFKPAGGVLTWAADDLSEKPVPIESIENAVVDSERELALQIVFTTEDNFVGTMEIPVSILDNDRIGQAGIVFLNTENLYTSESGDSVEISFALESRPSADVTISVSMNDATEGILSDTSFTFTSTNWNQLQSVNVTGIDDNFPDGDSTYELLFAIETFDTQYSFLPITPVAVTNRGDEPYVVGGEQFDQFLKGIPIESSMQNGQFAFSFKVPDTGFAYVFGSELSTDFGEWTPGPVPVKGATEMGLTTYTLVLPGSAVPQFARLTFDIEPASN